jgi:hypothetical protein
LSTLEYARNRLRSFLDEISRLEELEFPYSHSEEALKQLQNLFQRKLDRLEMFDDHSNVNVVKQESALALNALFTYLPLAGFVLRSTNVRNAFEVCRPLLRLAREVLEPDVEEGKRKTKLVLSSEWDYSPFVYKEIPDLPDFVLIGIPAPESANPLLVPLAGHELGHSLYAKHKLVEKWMPSVKANVINIIKRRWNEYKAAFPYPDIQPDEITTSLFAIQNWQHSVTWCLRQSEETFCDAVGMRIFGAAYLHAFSYLLSPNAGMRTAEYPSMSKRVDNLNKAASQFGINVPASYSAMFDDNPFFNLAPTDTFRVSLADEALDMMVPTIIAKTNELVSAAKISSASAEEIDSIYKSFKRVVPAQNCPTLAAILNAAWLAFHDDDLWGNFPQIAARKNGVLKELVLKTIEVFEIEHITRG